MLAFLLLCFVSTALLGTRDTTKRAVQLRMSPAVGSLLQAQSRDIGSEPHEPRWVQCSEALPGYSEDVIRSEMKNTSVGAMLGRAEEEEILKPLTICENHQPKNPGSKGSFAD